MAGMFEVKHISVSIQRSPSDVYAFVSNAENLPRWATGLGQKIRRVGDEWFAEGPLGDVKVRLVKPNDLGVADHDVTLPTGAVIHNAIRVIPNGTGSTVIFTLMRLSGVSEQKFADDAKWVEKDLTTLKSLLEPA
jgi:hypothetical protein